MAVMKALVKIYLAFYILIFVVTLVTHAFTVGVDVGLLSILFMQIAAFAFFIVAIKKSLNISIGLSFAMIYCYSFLKDYWLLFETPLIYVGMFLIYFPMACLIIFYAFASGKKQKLQGVPGKGSLQ